MTDLTDRLRADDHAPVSRAELRQIIQAATDYLGELTVYAAAGMVASKDALELQQESVKKAGDKLQAVIGPLAGIADHAEG